MPEVSTKYAASISQVYKRLTSHDTSIIYPEPNIRGGFPDDTSIRTPAWVEEWSSRRHKWLFLNIH